MKKHISLTKSTGNPQSDRAMDELRRKINPVLKSLQTSIDDLAASSGAENHFYESIQTTSGIAFHGTGFTENTELALTVPEDGVFEIYLFQDISATDSSFVQIDLTINVELNGNAIPELRCRKSELRSTGSVGLYERCTIVSKPMNLTRGSTLKVYGTSGNTTANASWTAGTTIWVKKI